MLKQLTTMAGVFFLLVTPVLAMNLTSSDIERFIGTYEQLMPHIDDFDFDDDDDDDDDDLAFLDAKAMEREFMEVLSGNREAEAIIRRNGYASVSAFAQQSAHIMRAYIAHTVMNSIDEFQASLREMPADEREAMMAMPFFQSFPETREQFADVPPAQIRAILPYRDQLDALFDMGEDDLD